jgi:hypothetical protein
MSSLLYQAGEHGSEPRGPHAEAGGGGEGEHVHRQGQAAQGAREQAGRPVQRQELI